MSTKLLSPASAKHEIEEVSTTKFVFCIPYKDHPTMSTNLDQYYNNYKKFCPPRIAMKLGKSLYLLGGGGGGGGAPRDGGGGGGLAFTALGFPEDFEPPPFFGFLLGYVFVVST